MPGAPLRVAHVVLLAGALAVFASGLSFSAVFVGWGLAAVGLAVAAFAPAARRTALACLGLLVVLLAVGIAGAGATIAFLPARWIEPAWGDLGWPALLAANWLPAGLFLALTERTRAARVARAGVALMLG